MDIKASALLARNKPGFEAIGSAEIKDAKNYKEIAQGLGFESNANAVSMEKLIEAATQNSVE